MAQQRKRTAGDDLRDFKAGKISGNFYHNGIDRSDNYIQHTSAPYRMINDKGKVQIASYNEWIQQEVFQHQHDLPNDTSSTSSNNKTATNDISVKSSNNTTGSDIKSFFSENLNKANSDAENFKEAIKNPNKSLNDRVKGLTYMYNAAVATGDTKTAEKMQKEYDELADRVNKQTEINRQNAKEYARSQSLKGMTEERKALVDERNKYALDNGLVTSTGIDTRKKNKYKVYSEYSSKIDELDKQIAEKQRNGEYDLSDSQKAVLADIGDKANKLTESFENKYKNSTLEQRLNARLHATTSERNWLNKHMYDNSSSKELEDYNNQLNKEANSLWNQRDEEQAYNRLKAIEDEQGKLKTAIDNAKLSEQKKKEYDDIVNNDIKAKTVLQKYYALQEYSSNQSLVRSEENTDDAKNKVILDDYNYINKLSGKERNQIVKDFNNLKKEGYDTESLYKWYKRERDAESAAETTRVYTDYADKHPVLGSLQSVGVRLTGAVPDAIKYISTELDKKYNGGDGYINPEETGTAISDAMRAKVSDNINNDFGSFLYNTGMSMADFASLLPLNAVPGGQALSLGIMGTSAGVGSANEVINNGGTIDNAVKTGIASGIAETLFEKVSLEQLSAFKASGKSTFRAAVGNVLKGAFTEGSEEAFTDLANRLTDDAINKDLSSYNLSVKKYMEQGMSEAEAENAASWDFWKNVGLDFAGGAVSGGVLNLATAGVNLAGAKIDMAQNKESNAQIGKAVMADENFDLDLLIRQGLATDKNDRAYNYATKMQKLIETDNEGKISAGDVGNLMYLINREVAKNPELVNRIAQVKKQNTQEQSNQAVNAQNEQSSTQQNTAQNGQQNAEQAQANTVINATKKADTEDIGKMYGAYAFGKKHPNGIIATDTSTGKVVKVALKSLESSAKINRSDEENTLIFNTNDGKQVNADSITFSDSQLDAVAHSANEFDTYGARNYISNFEEWRESPQAQKMSDDEMLYKYNRAYSAAYSFGREGVKLDSLRETSEYKILKNILGEQIVSQALSTGRRDVDINTQHHANRLTELINRNGRADTSGVSVYADSGTDVSHIPQELISALGNLATKTGRNIIISDRLADGVNGVARDGNIILSSEISSQKILATALHEAGHMIKKTNPTEWRTLSDFVSDYLVRKSVDLNKMIDRTIERYGNRLQADEHENTRDAALEEIVCNTLMSIASDEKALNIALSTKQNKAKIAAAIKSLINKVKDWLIGKSTNYGAKAFAKDLEALEKLAQRFSEAADTAKENITEQTEIQNGEKIDVEKFSLDEDYDSMDEKAGAIHDTLNFSIDDEYDDLFDLNGNDEQHIDFDKAIDQNNPELTIEQIYHHSARNVKEGLLAGKGIKPEQKKIYNMVKSVMRSYHINPNAETDSLVTEYVDALNTFIDSVQNDKSSFTDAFESFVLKCREALQYSTQLDEQHEAWAKEIRDELRGTTLLIPENAIDTIKENYGSVGKYKKALFGKINVKLEHNAKGINGNAVGSYIEDIGSHLENIGGRSLMIEDGFEWDSDSGYRMLDHIMNYVLAPQYVATYDGKFQSESTIDAAAIQMAFDTTAEYLKQQGKAAVMQNNIDKRKLRDINKALRQAEKAKTALNQKTIENYKTDIAEQKAKYNEQREKYRQAYNSLKDKKSEEAKRYRDKIHELEELSKNQKAIIKTVKDTFRAQYTEKREQTKYMQMLGKKFDKLVKKFDAKSKNTENIPESLKRPILNVLIGFKESADPGQYKNGNQKTIPKYFGAWNNVAEIGEQVRNLYEEYKSLAPKPKDKSEDNPAPKGMQYSYIDINTIAYNEQTAQMLEIITDQFAVYATDENGETIYDADGKPIKVGYKNIFDLDSSDLRLLYDTMTALEASLTQATEIIVNGQRKSIASAAAKALDEVSNVNYNKGININVLSKNTVGNKINAALSDMKELSNRFVATSLDPVRYGRFLSGYNDASIVAKLFKDLHDGDVKREKIMQKAYTKVQSVAYQYSEKDLAKIQKNDVKEFDFRDTKTGERVKVSQGIIMSIYLTDQQSSGRRHLLADRLNHYTVLPDLDSANSRRHSKQEKAKSENHHKVRFTFEELQHIKRYVESNKMLREISGAISEVLNNELQQEINEVSMSKYGMLIATVRNYFPISVYSDGAAYEKDFSAEFNDLRMKSRGFVKRRESSSAPIVIDDVFRVFNRHASSVAEWCGLTTPIENFKKVYNWINTNSINGTTVHEAIMHKYGKVAEHYIDKLMGDLQKSKDTIDNNLLTRMQGNYMGAVLLLNPGAMIKQFAAFPTANAYFGTKNVAIASAGGMWRVDLEKYAEYTPYLWYRAEGNGTVVGELSKKAGVVGGLKDKIDIMGKVDRYVVGCLLKAAELHVEQTTKLKKGSDAFYKEVVRKFEKCVDETQPNNMVTSKPQFIRNNVLKILSMNAFRSQTMAIGNTIIDSYMEYRTKSNDYKLSKSAENKSAKKVAMKKFAKALIGATESALLIGGLTTLVNMLLWHKWDDERDDKGNVTAENIFKSILDYSMESFAGTFTFGDTAYSAIAHKIDNDRPFYGLDSMSLDNVNNFVENISNGKYILAATLLGDCFGFPASNIKRMALSLTSYFTDLTKGRGEIISDNKGNINTTVLVPLMINATIDGDADKAQYYEQLYVNTIMDVKGKTEKEARDMLEQKVITALSKNNDDIEKAAVARANGDLNTYESLINKVSSYGFGKDDVIKASDKVISNIIANMKKEGITDEDAAKSDLVDNQGFTEQGAEYIWKKMSSSTDDEKSEESIFDSTGNDDALMYKYTDAFEYLKNGDTANYEKVEKYLMEHKGKTKNQMKKLMQSASRTDPIFKKYIEASKNNDADTTHTLYRQLLNIYGSESKFKSALKKYQDKVKKQQSK